LGENPRSGNAGNDKLHGQIGVDEYNVLRLTTHPYMIIIEDDLRRQ